MLKPAPYVAPVTAGGTEDPLVVAEKLQIKSTAAQYATLDITSFVELLLDEGVILSEESLTNIYTKLVDRKVDQLTKAHDRRVAEAKGEAPTVRLPEALQARLDAARVTPTA